MHEGNVIYNVLNKLSKCVGFQVNCSASRISTRVFSPARMALLISFLLHKLHYVCKNRSTAYFCVIVIRVLNYTRSALCLAPLSRAVATPSNKQLTIARS